MRSRALLALALLAPCAALAGVRPRYGGELRVLLPAAPAELDPARVRGAAELVAARATGATLLEVDEEGALRPALLEELPAIEEGGRAFRLRLAPGLSFHDGEPLTAARVAESLTRLAGPSSPNAFLVASIAGARAVHEGRTATLAGVEVLSERELRIVLAYPFPGFPAVLATLPTAIVHPRPEGGVCGAGPFRPVERRPRSLRLEAFDGYFGGRPFADALELLGPEPHGGARPSLGGEAEVVLRPEPQRGRPPTEGPLLGLVLALVSPRLGPAAEPTRAALAALDRADLARLVRAPARPLASLLGAGSRPPDGAAPGPGEGLPARLRLLLPDVPDAPRAAAARLQVKLYDRGVRVALESAASAEFAERLYGGAYDAALVPVWLVSREPALVLSEVAAAAGGYERGSRALAEAASDGARLPALAAALESDLAVVPLYASGLRASVREGVEGLGLLPDGTLDLAAAWLMPAGSGP
ncbi:MAG TPA: ABC transporter substrate-binding protein [Anaeromyxobacteraceae bacterium]|nr:ABC transporter substrate-binding protein [Anaeromyxobacteraceae bacterium]